MQQQATAGPTKPVSVDAVAQRISEVSTLPQVALKVVQVAKDPTTGARELKTVVESDPALTARVLRAANSASNALRSKITNPQQAISFLGFSRIRNLAMTASVSDLFQRDEAIGTYHRTMLWEHQVAVAVCARFIASRCKLTAFEDAYLAGLLHDIGIILEDQYVHECFAAAIRDLSEEHSLTETEQKHLGFDHTMLGTRLAEAWSFPPVVQAAIRYHHMSQSCGDEEVDLVRCVEIANFLCTLKGFSSVGLALIRPPVNAMDGLGLQPEDVKILAVDLDGEIEREKELFQLA